MVRGTSAEWSEGQRISQPDAVALYYGRQTYRARYTGLSLNDYAMIKKDE